MLGFYKCEKYNGGSEDIRSKLAKHVNENYLKELKQNGNPICGRRVVVKLWYHINPSCDKDVLHNLHVHFSAISTFDLVLKLNDRLSILYLLWERQPKSLTSILVLCSISLRYVKVKL